MSYYKKLQETRFLAQRGQLICPRHPTYSVRRQCELLDVPRGTLYYTPILEKPDNLKLMTLLDKHLTDHPTEGSRSTRLLLRDKGYPVGRKRVHRLLRIMGWVTIYRRKNLTMLGSREHIRPHLMLDYRLDRVNQALCTSITYIPMKHGFMYLMAVMDIYSRQILNWGISNTMEASWCLQVLSDAETRYGKPEIIKTDQGSQYPSVEWTRYVKNQLEAKMSMDGKGRSLGNVWVERFWKTIKCDYIYMHPADDGSELFRGVQNHICNYNQKHHQTLKTSLDKLYQKSMETLN